jgi:hypothetical protein
MTDQLNLYPKTSCPCYFCPTEFPTCSVTPTTGFKSSLSVANGIVPEVFDYTDKLQLSTSIQPNRNAGWYSLNPQNYTSKIDPTFQAIACKSSNINAASDTPKCCPQSCPQPTWISLDPRQRDQLRGDYLVLDAPPMNGKVKLSDIYSSKYTNYGNISNSGVEAYNQIKDGDITYYIDKSISPAFYYPVFAEEAKEQSILFQDPMGAMKPEYNRKAILNTENPTTEIRDYPYGLSFIQDTQSFREDIMSLQQRKNNQSKWSARWADNVY